MERTFTLKINTDQKAETAEEAVRQLLEDLRNGEEISVEVYDNEGEYETTIHSAIVED